MKQEKTAPKLTASQRQLKFVEDKRKKGYVLLSSLFVPKQIKDECRELVKTFVAKWEAEHTVQF